MTALFRATCRRFPAILGSLPIVMMAPLAQAAMTPGEQVVADVRGSLASRDCRGAVQRLQSGLKKDYPEVALLAGTMYEHGVCLGRDWSKAVTLYSLAFNGGQKEAAQRLSAGYADAVNGPDQAAAIWWGWRGGALAHSFCAASEPVRDNPDRFESELAKWPQERLAFCTYVAGVMSTIASEVKYPERAGKWAVGGDVTLRFFVDVPRVDLRRGETREYVLTGLIDGDALRDRTSDAVVGGFEATLAAVAQRALQRYPQPPGIAQDTVVEAKYAFTVRD